MVTEGAQAPEVLSVNGMRKKGFGNWEDVMKWDFRMNSFGKQVLIGHKDGHKDA